MADSLLNDCPQTFKPLRLQAEAVSGMISL